MSEQTQVPIGGIEGNQPGVETTKTVVQVTEQLANQYATPGTGGETQTKRKRGRPAGSKNGQGGVANDAGKSQAGGDTVDKQQAGYAIDRKIVEKTALTVLSSVDMACKRKIFRVATKLGADENLAKEMTANAGLAVAEAQLMGELTGVIFEKYGLLTGYAPEVLLGVMVTQWGVRMTLTMRRLTQMEVAHTKRLAKEKKEREQDAPDTSAN